MVVSVRETLPPAAGSVSRPSVTSSGVSELVLLAPDGQQPLGLVVAVGGHYVSVFAGVVCPPPEVDIVRVKRLQARLQRHQTQVDVVEPNGKETL